MTGFGKNGKGQILYRTGTLSLGTLSPDTVALNSLFLVEEDFRVLKVDYHIAIDNVPENDLADGALMFGFCDGALTAAQVEECIESAAVDRNDHEALERSHRPVWPEGFLKVLSFSDVDSEGILAIEGTWSPRWTFSDAEGFDVWWYLMANSALQVTTTARYLMKIYGVWVT